jgi:ElaB/YqjD/DUF883 family membrane-anchored ribosome-binding protein
MATSPKPAPTATDVEEQFKTIRDDISKLTTLLKELSKNKVGEARKAAQDEVEGLLKRSKDVAEEATAKAKEAAGSVEDYISEKPVQSALIALLVGIFIGSLSRR